MPAKCWGIYHSEKELCSDNFQFIKSTVSVRVRVSSV